MSTNRWPEHLPHSMEGNFFKNQYPNPNPYLTQTFILPEPLTYSHPTLLQPLHCTYCHSQGIWKAQHVQHLFFWPLIMATKLRVNLGTSTLTHPKCAYSIKFARQHNVQTQCSTFRLFNLFYSHRCCIKSQLFKHLRRILFHLCTTAAALLLFT